MSYNSSLFSGLTAGRDLFGVYGSEIFVELQTGFSDGTGFHGDGPRDATFSYDDTAFGAVPDGMFFRLGTCAGQAVQLELTPAATLANSDASDNTLTAMSASMAGFGDLDIANDGASFAAGSIVTVASELPIVSSTDPFPGRMLLLRPTPLDPVSYAWAGRDDSNAALRTLWLPSEVGVVSYSFSVNAEGLLLFFLFEATGFNVVT